MHIPSTLRILSATSLVALLAGCQAANTMINHSDLTVQTHMSETIFLDPVPQSDRTVYVSARNTSDHPEIDLRGTLSSAIAARGYQVVTDADSAHYMLRINVLQAGEVKEQDKAAMFAANYGEPLLATAGTAVLASGLGANNGTAVGLGLGAGIATFAANQLVKDVTYAVTVDIQLSERPRSGAKVSQTTNTLTSQANGSASAIKTAQPPQGGRSVSGSASLNASAKTQHIDEQVDFKQYQLREIAYADQMNLKFEQAAPLLVAKLNSTLSNLFE